MTEPTYEELDIAIYNRLMAGEATAEDQRTLAFYLLSDLEHVRIHAWAAHARKADNAARVAIIEGPHFPAADQEQGDEDTY